MIRAILLLLVTIQAHGQCSHHAKIPLPAGTYCQRSGPPETDTTYFWPYYRECCIDWEPVNKPISKVAKPVLKKDAMKTISIRGIKEEEYPFTIIHTWHDENPIAFTLRHRCGVETYMQFDEGYGEYLKTLSTTGQPESIFLCGKYTHSTWSVKSLSPEKIKSRKGWKWNPGFWIDIYKDGKRITNTQFPE
jgi:hypothetical protein